MKLIHAPAYQHIDSEKKLEWPSNLNYYYATTPNGISIMTCTDISTLLLLCPPQVVQDNSKPS